MVSIALGVFILCIVYVIVWSLMNDKAGAIRDQTGIIRMRVPPGEDVDGGKAAAAAPRFGSRQSRRLTAQRRRAAQAAQGDVPRP